MLFPIRTYDEVRTLASPNERVAVSTDDEVVSGPPCSNLFVNVRIVEVRVVTVVQGTSHFNDVGPSICRSTNGAPGPDTDKQFLAGPRHSNFVRVACSVDEKLAAQTSQWMTYPGRSNRRAKM